MFIREGKAAKPKVKKKKKMHAYKLYSFFMPGCIKYVTLHLLQKEEMIKSCTMLMSS